MIVLLILSGKIDFNERIHKNDLARFYLSEVNDIEHKIVKEEIHMKAYKISLMDAYLIETLRSNDISNEEIVSTLKEGHIESWQELYIQFDFNELLELANKDFNQFEEILDQGYQVKFITFNGLKNLLRMRFGKKQEKDYLLMEKGIKDLVLNQEQLVSLKQMLSGNWVLEEARVANKSVVSIELI